MSRRVDLLIVGAGPAGLSAAVAARRHGLDVLVVDEQPAPGGQIWRGVEAADPDHIRNLGASYAEGAAAVGHFRASGAAYEPQTQVWQVEPGPRAYMTRAGAASLVEAGCLLLATGAQERPVPFPGWTLPGVMTVGAAQILIKTAGQVPTDPVWIAGSGPLPLLYAVQLVKAGGRIAGFLDTTPRGRAAAALPSLPAAVLGASGDLAKGLAWIAGLRRAGVPFIRHVSELTALGETGLERIRYRADGAEPVTVEARLLLVHEGVVPTIHPTLALGCAHDWIADQDCFAPRLDRWGETSEPNVFVAGDGAGIGGATAACLRGEIAAAGIAARLGRITEAQAEAEVAPVRARLARALKSRPFLDALYRPRPAVFVPADETIACRCEEVTVGTIRAQAAATGRPGPNQVKAFTRAGMGPCQGRQCAYTVASVLAAEEGRPIPDVGLYRVRPPLKPVTLGELAALEPEAATP